MRPRKRSRPIESTRDCILQSAKSVFSKLGFDGASIKAIAESSKTNVALVSYYFGGKEGLYRACLEEFGKNRRVVMHSILSAPHSRADFQSKLRLWMESFFQAHLEDPEIVRILHREMVEEIRVGKAVFEKYFLQIFSELVKFLEHSRELGFVRKDVDPYFAASFLMSTMGDTVRIDPIRKKFHKKTLGNEKFRNALVDQFLGFFSKGLESGEKE